MAYPLYRLQAGHMPQLHHPHNPDLDGSLNRDDMRKSKRNRIDHLGEQRHVMHHHRTLAVTSVFKLPRRGIHHRMDDRIQTPAPILATPVRENADGQPSPVELAVGRQGVRSERLGHPTEPRSSGSDHITGEPVIVDDEGPELPEPSGYRAFTRRYATGQSDAHPAPIHSSHMT